MFTVEEAKEYVEDNLEDIRSSFKTDPSVPPFMRSSARAFEMWKAGCWLNEMLKRMGAENKARFAIGFCHGQRSAFSTEDGIWMWAVYYANEYASNGRVMDRPGIRLADQIIAETIKAGDRHQPI